ncbi:hypothetical protein 035JT004_116 [Bacillus phage 035JT004]|nr:hypothetical protein 035JT004_116 [Bacillus phage 035JT004]
MTRESVFKKENEIVLVRLNESGSVVLKQGKDTRVFRPSVSFDDVANTFRENGWAEAQLPEEKKGIKEEVQASIDSLTGFKGFKVVASEEPTMIVAKTGTGTSYLAEAAQNSLDQEVSLEIIQKVDQYIELHKQAAELKSRMEELKKPVRTYMQENNHKKIKGTKGGSVVLQDATASNSTAVYSNYELGDIAPLVSTNFLNKITESRINSEKLEGLLKTDEGLDKETIEKIKEAKIVKPGTPRFTVKK